MGMKFACTGGEERRRRFRAQAYGTRLIKLLFSTRRSWGRAMMQSESTKGTRAVAPSVGSVRTESDRPTVTSSGQVIKTVQDVISSPKRAAAVETIRRAMAEAKP